MSSYDHWLKRLKQQLACYKISRLGVEESGIWKGNGKPYEHILPEHLGQTS